MYNLMNLLEGLNHTVDEHPQVKGLAKTVLQYLYINDHDHLEDKKVYPIEVSGKVEIVNTILRITMSNGDKIYFAYVEGMENYIKINEDYGFQWEHSQFIEDDIPIDDGYVIRKAYERYIVKREFKKERIK